MPDEVVCGGLSLGRASGLAVARALRVAFGDELVLTALSDGGSAAAHDPVFDRLLRDEDAARMPSGAVWLPGSFRELERFARRVVDGRLLGPGATAAREAAAGLVHDAGLRTAAAISLLEDDWRLCGFCRAHGWDVRLVDAHGRQLQVDGWRSLLRLRARHVEEDAHWRLRALPAGRREAVAFAGYEGANLGVHHMRHGSDVRSMEVSAAAEAASELAEAVNGTIARSTWTGGGTVELVRAHDGRLWFDELVPAFPDWVHALALAGANLPAALLASDRAGRPAAAETDARGAFARVMVDVPLRGSLAAPADAPERDRRARRRERPREAWPSVADLPRAESTPFVHRLSPAARWSRIAAAVDAAGSSGCDARVAISLKTDPHPELLAAARDCGFLAEAITAHEAASACAAGFGGHQLVLNGPAKLWPAELAPRQAFAAFADSAQELTALAERLSGGSFAATFAGPRLRSPVLGSRFGTALDDQRDRDAIVEAIDRMPAGQAIGVHFHGSCSENGHARWFAAVDAVVAWAGELGRLTRRPVTCLDVGGGWFPDDFDTVLLPRLAATMRAWRRRLPALKVVLLEPGKALSQPCAAVETTVIDVIEREGRREAVVDASIAELPEAHEYPHRILSHGDDGWRPCGRGPDLLLGRLAMEIDVLAHDIALPDGARVGDRFLVADAGAYDRSLSFRFGYGTGG